MTPIKSVYTPVNRTSPILPAIFTALFILGILIGIFYESPIALYSVIIAITILLLILIPEFVISIFISGQLIIHFLFLPMGGISREAMPAEGGVILAMVLFFGIIKHILLNKDFFNFRYQRLDIIIIFIALLLGIYLLAGLTYTPALFYGKKKAFGYLLLNLSVFFMILIMIRKIEQMKRLLISIILLGIIQLIILMVYSLMTYQSIVISQMVFEIEKGEIYGLKIGYGLSFLKRFSVVILGLFISLYLIKKRWLQGLILCLLPFITLQVFSIGSRGPVLAMLLPFVFLILYIYKGQYVRILLALAAISLIGIALTLFLPEPISARYEDTVGFSVVERGDLYQMSWEMIKANPLQGVGTGGFSYTAFKLDMKIYPHNIFLEFLVENGLGAFILFCLFIYYIFKRWRLSLQKVAAGSATYFYLLFAAAYFLSALILAQTSDDIQGNNSIWIAGAIICQFSNLADTLEKENLKG